MSEFNPYHQWLGISETARPVSKYRLLAIDEFESDRGVISAAAEQRTIYLRTLQAGEHTVLVADLLNEVSQARVTLLNADQKAEYDEQLRKQQTPEPEAVSQEFPVSIVPTANKPRRKVQQEVWKQPVVIGVSLVGVLAVLILFISFMFSGDTAPAVKNSAVPVTTFPPLANSTPIPFSEPEPQPEPEMSAEYQFQTGINYYTGNRGVNQDYKEAIKWWRLAAGRGHREAQFNLGGMYRGGYDMFDMPQDYKESNKWYRLAAEQGHAEAQANLGIICSKSEGVPQDYIEAVKWFRLAAEQGHVVGQNGIGSMYHNGDGVPQDYKKAVKWYRLAAEQGFAIAQNNLGSMYSSGKGVPQNDKESVKWWRLAAEQGDAPSQGLLGYAFALGLGVPQDDKEAYIWLSLAVAGGQTVDDGTLKTTRMRLSAEQLDEAQKRASAFFKQIEERQK